jgi:hypothetical protein
MRERILVILLLVAVSEIAFGRIVYHSHGAKAASGRLVRVQPSLMTYPYPAKLAVGTEVLGFSCTTLSQSIKGPNATTPECFILPSDDQ